jgi:hypothetical protein
VTIKISQTFRNQNGQLQSSDITARAKAAIFHSAMVSVLNGVFMFQSHFQFQCLMTNRLGLDSVGMKDDVSCLGMPTEHTDPTLTIVLRWLQTPAAGSRRWSRICRCRRLHVFCETSISRIGRQTLQETYVTGNLRYRKLTLQETYVTGNLRSSRLREQRPGRLSFVAST